jgi:hypothetical protein
VYYCDRVFYIFQVLREKWRCSKNVRLLLMLFGDRFV